MRISESSYKRISEYKESQKMTLSAISYGKKQEEFPFTPEIRYKHPIYLGVNMISTISYHKVVFLTIPSLTRLFANER